MRCTSTVGGVRCLSEGTERYPMLGCVHEHMTPPVADCIPHYYFMMSLLRKGELACGPCKDAPNGHGHECVIQIVQDPDFRPLGVP